MCRRYQGKLNIVVSGWSNDPQVQLPDVNTLDSIKQLARLTLIEMPENWSTFPRLYFQVCTLLAGLQCVETEYFIRVRSDEFFSNLEQLYQMKIVSKGMMSSNIFVRNVTYHRFHFSDHFFLARTLVFRSALGRLKEYIEQNLLGDDPLGIISNETPPEVCLWLFYLQEKGWSIKDLLKQSHRSAFDVMRSEGDVFDVEGFKPYEISCKAAGQISCLRKFSKRANPLAVNDHRTMDDLYPSFMERVFPEDSKARVRFKRLKDYFRA